MQTMTCPHCWQLNLVEASVCKRCGQVLTTHIPTDDTLNVQELAQPDRIADVDAQLLREFEQRKRRQDRLTEQIVRAALFGAGAVGTPLFLLATLRGNSCGAGDFMSLAEAALISAVVAAVVVGFFTALGGIYL